MPKFVVKSQILMGGKMFRPGEEIELSEEQATAMPWAVVESGDMPVKAQARTRAQREEDAEREKRSKIERADLERNLAETGEGKGAAEKK